MEGQSNVMFCGFGGQGIVLAGVILGKAAVFDGLNAAQAASYGSEARGSACRSEVIISQGQIVYPHIEQADILGVMSQQGYDLFQGKLKEDGILFYDDSMVQVKDEVPFEQIGIPATELAIKEFDKRIVANIIFLGAVVGRTEIVSMKVLERAVRDSVPGKFLEVNLRALEVGRMLNAEY